MDRTGPIFFYPLRSVLTAFLAACFLADATLFASAQTGAAMIAIDRMTPGSPPAGFSFARTGQGSGGEWTVTADQTAAAGKVIELSFKAVAGKTDQAGGIAVRLADADNYYVARANALEDNVRFYRVVAGRREQLEGTNLRVSPNEWHTLGLRAEGQRFTVSFDGKKLFSATDRTFAGAGGVALWTKSDSVTRFDQFKITVLP
jgi:hypothetical protein